MQSALSVLTLASALFIHHLSSGPVTEYPLDNYCDVGVCPASIPNRLLGSPRQVAETACKRNPSSPYVWADLAEVAWRCGDAVGSRIYFCEALRAGSHNPDIVARRNSLLAHLQRD